MGRTDLAAAVARLDPDLQARLRKPLTAFAAGLSPKETIRAVRVEWGCANVVTNAAVYVLDERGHVKERRADPEGASSLPEDRLDAPLDVDLGKCRLLGGSGFPLTAGTHVGVRFDENGLGLWTGDADPKEQLRLGWSRIESLAITGPGTVQSGGGLIGGGFGLEGVLTGMAAATVLNALSTETSCITVLEIGADVGELFLLDPHDEPAMLRILLSGAFTRLRLERRAAGGSS